MHKTKRIISMLLLAALLSTFSLTALTGCGEKKKAAAAAEQTGDAKPTDTATPTDAPAEPTPTEAGDAPELSFEEELANRVKQFAEMSSAQIEEKSAEYLDYFRRSFVEAPLAACLRMGSIKMDDDITVMVYETVGYGRPLMFDETAFKVDYPDPRFECFTYALVTVYYDKNYRLHTAIFPQKEIVSGADKTTDEISLTLEAYCVDPFQEYSPVTKLEDMFGIRKEFSSNEPVVVRATVNRAPKNGSYEYGITRYCDKYGDPILACRYVRLTSNDGGYSQWDYEVSDTAVSDVPGDVVTTEGVSEQDGFSVSWNRKILSKHCSVLYLLARRNADDVQLEIEQQYLHYKDCIILLYSESGI